MNPTNNLAIILKNRSKFLQVSKASVEFVVTRFQEDLAWTSGLEHLVTVYNKGSADFDISGATIVSVPNFGAGLETVLRHIIMRYNSLADATMFCQGQIADRTDQSLYPLEWYFDFTTDLDTAKKGVKGVLTDSYDVPRSRYRSRLSNDSCKAVRDRTLRDFREKVVGIPYKYLVEFWVRGDWISVQRDVVRKKPLEYYKYLYQACQFGRGTFVEECWFLERSLYSIFTQPVRRDFVYSSGGKEVLLT
jgi:hypothetical protein